MYAPMAEMERTGAADTELMKVASRTSLKKATLIEAGMTVSVF
jgi:hypothetical protein